MADAAKAKTTEEYLVEIERKLLAAFDATHKAVDIQIALAYGLLLLLIVAASEQSPTVDFTFLILKLAMPRSQAMFYLSVIIIAVYFAISHNLVIIRNLITRILRNSEELTQLNDSARPLSAPDLRLLSSGSISMLLAIQARMLMPEPVIMVFVNAIKWIGGKRGHQFYSGGPLYRFAIAANNRFIVPVLSIIWIITVLLFASPLIIAIYSLLIALESASDIQTRLYLILTTIVCYFVTGIFVVRFAQFIFAASPEIDAEIKAFEEAESNTHDSAPSGT